ncbi:anthranilate synthase component 1 [Erysipelotrichaceae bacterium]|nr:anthranilate synthase component 1 [Erysipelotrichaceae bacterium]
MKIVPTRENYDELQRAGYIVPVYQTLFADTMTPILALRKLKEAGKSCFLLESVEGGKHWNRYSFLGVDSKFTLSMRDGILTYEEAGKKKQVDMETKQYITSYLAEYQFADTSELPPFIGGFVGYFSYDYVKYSYMLEKLFEQDSDVADMELAFYETIIAFDHLKQTIICLSIGSKSLKTYDAVVEQIGILTNLLQDSQHPKKYAGELISEFTGIFSKERYLQMVEDAQHYIREGDIFQVVLANRFEAKYQGDLLPTYRQLRMSNPSPYMFYLDFGSYQITGASPETLIALKGDILSTFPIAGTCKRGATDGEDKELVAALLANPKEVAEHNMLVDLGRNDIGKVSRFGSVMVEDYLKVLQFSHVSHITSKVIGVLASDFTQLDALEAIMPAGTLSGAPKKRALEIIAELEGQNRGMYGGALGYIDIRGNMDMCIAIRMAVKVGDLVSVSAGAGIVLDSIPENEFAESHHKALAMFEALKLAKEVD